jgi:cytochrome c peroxidase
MSSKQDLFSVFGRTRMGHAGGRLMIFPMIALLLALTVAVAGCGGGGGGGAAGGNLGGNPIPTPPAGLPALVPDAGGPSEGFRVALSPGMTVPAAPGALTSLVPQPLGGTIIDLDAAIRLGKALFWDTQVGSDGQVACASCHFNAGADNRTRNTINPGPDATFQVVPGAGAIFNVATFDHEVIDDVVGSGGVISMEFIGISADLDDPVDICTPVVPGNPAQAAIAAAGERLITGRNTPTAIGAVFFLNNFWDGRASQDFDGLSPLGDGLLVAGISSLASQALGPPRDSVEMTCAGREWNGPNGIGGKMVLRTPLANQLVDPTDSVLGPLSNAPGNGLDCGFGDRLCTYADLIAAAFGTNGLSGQAAVDFYADNFSSIWGQAVQAYEATLVPNRTPYDLGNLTAAQVNGLQAMRDSGCMVCHVEPEFSDATVRVINFNGGPGVQKIVVSNGQPVAAGGDQGFHNIGAAVTADDRGRAASPGGTYHVSVFNEGAFKTPGLRNVSMTAPFMHNGSAANIPDVLDFYNGTNQLITNLGFNEQAEVGLGGDRDDAAAFMLTGLTDCRVQNELAPFDHPSLVVPNGPSLDAVGAAGNGNACP